LIPSPAPLSSLANPIPKKHLQHRPRRSASVYPAEQGLRRLRPQSRQHWRKRSLNYQTHVGLQHSGYKAQGNPRCGTDA
ncbi:MAG: hypothetical protein ACO3EZ_18340, partial [Prochlorotrichaceae cyanobacterium]